MFGEVVGRVIFAIRNKSLWVGLELLWAFPTSGSLLFTLFFCVFLSLSLCLYLCHSLSLSLCLSLTLILSDTLSMFMVEDVISYLSILFLSRLTLDYVVLSQVNSNKNRSGIANNGNINIHLNKKIKKVCFSFPSTYMEKEHEGPAIFFQKHNKVKYEVYAYR